MKMVQVDAVKLISKATVGPHVSPPTHPMCWCLRTHRLLRGCVSIEQQIIQRSIRPPRDSAYPLEHRFTFCIAPGVTQPPLDCASCVPSQEMFIEALAAGASGEMKKAKRKTLKYADLGAPRDTPPINI